MEGSLRTCLGKVKAFSINGLRLWFNSSDHRPPHFHAKKSGIWEIRIFILECWEKNLVFDVKALFGKRGPTSAEQQKLALLVVSHREKLLQEWEEKVCIKEEI